MYKVVGLPPTRTMRILWMLEELGQDYEIDPSRPHSDPVKTGNPGGKVPTLHDGDAIIPDTVAICTYLADKHGACTHPAGTAARAWQDAITQFCVEEFEGPLWTVSKNTFVHPEEQRAGDVVRVCRWEFEKTMRTLASHLADSEFIAGGIFTIPDLLMGHCAGWAARIKFEIPAGRVADYLARMRARPALARAMERGEAAMAAA